ncbi:hypothetical protein [Acinetobacter sp. Marseille-Q1618]|uniref:hypothetical protein n=1 Tax=Acinetobacter sp. Marseille-Q1618 TaxID=2697502 RepID=UPI001570AFB6|nr:hypothetical protein [Acinetobacter sp. Marseille-Q1618]
MTKKNKILMLLVLLMTSSLAFSKPEQITLKKQNISVLQNQQLCELLSEHCQEKPNWALYKTAQQQYYLIDHLKLYQLKNENKNWHIQAKWDFSDYPAETQTPHWAKFQQDDQKNLSIFPKLFPVSATEYAIAIVGSWSEGYSGGGMGEEVADFLKIKNNGQYMQLFQNIPLSMYRMVRACFSEADYEEAQGKCHDEAHLATEIEYVKSGTWKIKYYFEIDYSPASDSLAKSFKQHRVLILDRNHANAIQLPQAWLDN